MTVELYTHPEYRRNLHDWQTLRDLYCGNETTMRSTRYLPKFAVEDEELSTHAESKNSARHIYTQRMARTFYTNLCDPIVWIWIGWLFSEALNLDSISRIVTPEEQANFDGKGTSFIDIAQEMARVMILYGPTYAVIDTPGFETQTRAEDAATGKRPYGQIIDPIHVPDWRIRNVNFSDTGQYEQLDYIWQAVTPRASGRDAPQEQWFRRSLYFDSENSIISEYFAQPTEVDQVNMKEKRRFNPFDKSSEWEELERQTLSELTQLPIVRGGKQSWILPAASNMRRRHQLESSFENILHYQAYQKVFISGEPLQDSMVMAENSINFLKEGSVVTQVTSATPTALETRVRDVTDTIFKIAFNQIRTLPGTSEAVQSSETIREERQPQFAAAKSAITEFETMFNSIVDVWAEMKGIERNESEKVTISRDFTPEDIDKFVTHYNTFRDEINKNTAWRRATLEKAVDDANFDSETANEIKETLADAPRVQNNVRESLIGAINNANSEGDTGEA